MDSLFYDDLEYGSSLLQPPVTKNDLNATLNGKLHGIKKDDKKRNMNGNGRNSNFEMRSILKNNNHEYDGYYTSTAAQHQCNQMDHKVFQFFYRCIGWCSYPIERF